MVFVFILIIVILISGQNLNRDAAWSSGLEGIIRGTLTFGDINNDGNLDLILSGQNTSVIIKVYINNGTSLIENSTWESNLTAFTRGSLALGDIDNDGDLDLALSGCTGDVPLASCTGNTISKIYINNGTSFVESQQWEQNLTPVYWGSLAFGDINNDGKLDLGLVGNSYDGRIAKVYINNGTTFTESPTWQNSLIGIDEGSIAFGDVDNDGKLDLALTGLKTASPYKISTMYINNGTSFVESSIWWNSYSLHKSSLAFGDINNDEKLDLMHMGCCDHLYFYLNNGSSLILNQTDTISGGDQLAGIFDGSLTLGDIDNDGYLDLATMGREELRSGIYQWNGTEFVRNDTIGADFIADKMQQGSLAFIDINNDTILDLTCGGYSYGNSPTTKVYINNGTVNNTLPSPPTTFNSDYDDGILNLTWGNGSDSETPALGLYYNLMVGNSTTNHTIVSGVYGGSSNPTAGYFGNMMQRKSIELNLDLDNGTYYWYVQTIDTGLAKSSWSTRQSFTVGTIADTTAPTISSVSSSSITSSTAVITWTTGESANSSVYYGTTTALGSSSVSASLSETHSIGLSGLSASTLYYYNVSSCDIFNNCNTSSQYNFTTSASGSEDNGNNNGNNNPGGSTPPKTVVWTQTYSVGDEDFTGGYTKELSAKNRLQISINNETHYVGISELTNSTATLNISSEPQIATLSIGDMRRFEVNGDNYYDINVTLNSINTTSNKANITILSIHDEITNQTISEEQTKEETAQEKKKEDIKNEKRLWYSLVVGVVVILIIIVIIFLIKYLKRKKENES